MKKANKIALLAFVILVSITVIVYFYPRQNAQTEDNIVIKGVVSNPQNLTISQIEAFSPVTVQVTVSGRIIPSENGVFNYTGVPLKVLLDHAHILKNVTSVFIQAPDRYAITLSIQDSQKENTILAYLKDGETMTPLSKGGEGPVRLIIGDESFPHNWVKGVSLIEVRWKQNKHFVVFFV